jgi:hypothetical protein
MPHACTECSKCIARAVFVSSDVLAANSGRVVTKGADPDVANMLLGHMYGLEVEGPVQQVRVCCSAFINVNRSAVLMHCIHRMNFGAVWHVSRCQGILHIPVQAPLVSLAISAFWRSAPPSTPVGRGANGIGAMACLVL